MFVGVIWFEQNPSVSHSFPGKKLGEVFLVASNFIKWFIMI